MNRERVERLLRLRHAQTEAERAKVVARDQALRERRSELSRRAHARAARIEALRQSEGRVLTGQDLADLHAGAEQTVRVEVRVRRQADQAERSLAQAMAEAVEAHREEERMRRLMVAERERVRDAERRRAFTAADEQMLLRIARRPLAEPGAFGTEGGAGEGEDAE